MKKLGSLLVGVALSAGLQAATLSYSFTSDEEYTDFDYTGRLGLFDGSLGTLTGVSLELYGEFTTTLTLGNSGKAAMRKARAMVELDMFFGSTLSALDGLLAQDGSPWVSWSLDTGNVQVAPHGSVTYGPITDGGMAVIDAGSLLSSFTVAGGGDFGLNCTSLTPTMVILSGGNGWFSQTTTGACSATVTYTYEEAPPPPPFLPPTDITGGGGAPIPVPEPPSLAVLGLGLAYMAARGAKARKA